MTFAQALLETRKTRELKQKEVSAQLGVAKGTDISWELGKSVPKLRMLKRLKAHLGVDMDQLVELFE